MLIPKSYFNLNNNSRLHLHRKPIITHDNLLNPPPRKALVKLGKLGILLLDELVQLIDTLDLLVTDGCVDEVLLFHLTKLVYSYVRSSCPKQYSDIKMTLVTFKKTAYYIAIQQKKIIPTETSRDLHGGEEGIRTHKIIKYPVSYPYYLPKVACTFAWPTERHADKHAQSYLLRNVPLIRLCIFAVCPSASISRHNSVVRHKI